MSLYPKIETLFDRDENFKVSWDSAFRRPEFSLLDRWVVTEKVDGTNVRVELRHNVAQGWYVKYRGRSNDSQMPPALAETLERLFPVGTVRSAFPDVEANPIDEDLLFVVLYGEGYGPKIQKGGIYRSDISFRLFDVKVGSWWLNWPDVEDVAKKLGIQTVPLLDREQPMDLVDIVEWVHHDGFSFCAAEDSGEAAKAEGVVCRTDPLLFCRDRTRLMWKLKTKDFA